MSVNPITTSLHDSLEKVVQKMNQSRVGSIIVVDQGRPVGMITERDILVRVVAEGKLAKDVKAADVMSAPIQMVSEGIYVEEAAKVMVKNKVKRLGVSRDGQIVGIITATDIVKAVAVGLLTREVCLYLSDIFKMPPLSNLLNQQFSEKT